MLLPFPLNLFLKSSLKAFLDRRLAQLRAIALLLVASLLLSGCVDYDVGIHFDSPSQGEIVQHLHVSDRLRSLNDDTVRQWTQLITQRARSLGGKVEGAPNQELIVTIPFSEGKDLATKFNQFFASDVPPNAAQNRSQRATAALLSDLPEIPSQLVVHRRNLLLFEYTAVQYDLDLRSLGVAAGRDNVLLSPAALVNLEFTLDAPWGISSRSAARRHGNRLSWTLTPGVANHIEAAFWMPNGIGLGAAVIATLVWVGGWWQRSRHAAPASPSPSASL